MTLMKAKMTLRLNLGWAVIGSGRVAGLWRPVDSRDDGSDVLAAAPSLTAAVPHRTRGGVVAQPRRPTSHKIPGGGSPLFEKLVHTATVGSLPGSGIPGYCFGPPHRQ